LEHGERSCKDGRRSRMKFLCVSGSLRHASSNSAVLRAVARLVPGASRTCSTGWSRALLNAAPAGGAYAQASLAETLRTMNWRVVEEACLMEPFVSRRIGGELVEPAALAKLGAAIAALRDHLSTARSS
ncbi:MAG: hypothetical protein ACLGH0_01310, partial [Thermoanaerobaculia bacterium]